MHSLLQRMFLVYFFPNVAKTPLCHQLLPSRRTLESFCTPLTYVSTVPDNFQDASSEIADLLPIDRSASLPLFQRVLLKIEAPVRTDQFYPEVRIGQCLLIAQFCATFPPRAQLSNLDLLPCNVLLSHKLHKATGYPLQGQIPWAFSTT